MHVISPKNIPEKIEIENFLKDFKNLSYHKKIIEKAVEIAKNIKEVEAVFLLGSLANDTGDLFSDIDFFIMYEDDTVREDIFNIFMKNVEKLGAIIHISESSATSNDLIIFMQTLVK